MSQMMGWLCLICVTFLIFDIMFYFCKDALRICQNVDVPKAKRVTKVRNKERAYTYEHKIAK
ncbi:hypothetical protein [Faecalimicrobium dakarense]|uniref:hypothetical protein n=1 Tax=Faecalimicrobium dakarense TaxID=1301100 RepID=UPI0004B8F588|nr:hypothetical protein [[Clostridium] dakarense]